MSGNFKNYHSYIHTGGIMLLAAGLPLSPFLVTISQIILMANWLAEGDLKFKLQRIWERKALFVFLLIFIVHLVWLIPTQDFSYALEDLKTKLPIFILPLVLGTGRTFKDNNLKIILLVFIAAVLVSSFFSIYRLSVIASIPTADLRDISVFISHLRLSLLAGMAIFSLIYILVTASFQWNRPVRNILWASLAWLILFLFILQSLTGIAIFIGTGILFLIRFSNRLDKQYWYLRYPLMYGLIILIFIISAYTLYVVLSFSGKPFSEDKLQTLTSGGNPYEHFPGKRQMENGNYVWINICEPELKEQWNRLSSIEYSGHDLKGNEINQTLIRYLTSRGLKKDSEGISKLTETDIINIERGMNNHIYQHNKWLYPRIYKVVWEIDNYRKGGNPSGHSFAQRFEYIKTGFDIIKNNFWFGVGTGDVAIAFQRQYAENETTLAPEWQLKANNQYITFLISFGITGFTIVMFGMIAPYFMEKRQFQILPFIFACIALMSMFTEDTLEAPVGAAFFAFFYALFIFAMEKNEFDENDVTD